MKERRGIIIAAKVLSIVFRPNYYPLVGFIILFTMTYLALLPWGYKLIVLGIVYLLTIALPALATETYRRLRGWRETDLRHQHKRIMPLILNVISYGACLQMIHWLRLPAFVSAIIVISMLVQVACVLFSIWTKISVHSTGAGALIGGLMAYSMIFQFNPVWWLCLALLVSGLVNSSRMLLRQHTLGQVLGGTLVGVICGLLGIYLL